MHGGSRGGEERRGGECGSGQMKGERENEIMKGAKKDGGGVNLVKAAETKCPHKRNGKEERSRLSSVISSLCLPNFLSLLSLSPLSLSFCPLISPLLLSQRQR